MKSISKKITSMLLSPVLAAVMILGTLSTLAISCGDNGSNSTKQVEPQYTVSWDIYDITVKDATGGSKIDSILDKLQEALDGASSPSAPVRNILSEGLNIVVEEGTGVDYQIIDKYTISLDYDFLMGANNTIIRLRISQMLGTMNSMGAAVCECPITDHLGIGEDCCNTADCVCTVKVYGELYDGGPKIYRMGEVTETDMADAVTKAQTGYAGLVAGLAAIKTEFEGKVDELYILAASDVTHFYKNINGKLVLGLRVDRNATAMGNRMGQIANGTLVPVPE